jgi:hypothetical protein
VPVSVERAWGARSVCIRALSLLGHFDDVEKERGCAVKARVHSPGLVFAEGRQCDFVEVVPG